MSSIFRWLGGKSCLDCKWPAHGCVPAGSVEVRKSSTRRTKGGFCQPKRLPESGDGSCGRTPHQYPLDQGPTEPSGDQPKPATMQIAHPPKVESLQPGGTKCSVGQLATSRSQCGSTRVWCGPSGDHSECLGICQSLPIRRRQSQVARQSLGASGSGRQRECKCCCTIHSSAALMVSRHVRVQRAHVQAVRATVCLEGAH